MPLTGRSLIAGLQSNTDGTEGTQGLSFTAMNPHTGAGLGPEYISASSDDVEQAAVAAELAFSVYGKLPGTKRALFLREIAKRLEATCDPIVERASVETALAVPRLQGELQRTANQLCLFAQVLEEGSWVMARIDRAMPARIPLPRPDLRSMLCPLGPVVVFGASNFPLAFSVAGGDTASAFAAGNPVIVKAHPAHPATSELVGQVITSSVQAMGLPAGVFSLLFDKGIDVGTALVQHPLVKAVGFTGSLAAGRALMDLAAARPDPIPCFAEMSSINPVFILPGALRERGEQIAKDLYASITLGGGQFCTKPGLIFVPASQAAGIVAELIQLAQQSSPCTMLTDSIATQFSKAIAERIRTGCSQIFSSVEAERSRPFKTPISLLRTDAASLSANPAWSHEIFGPAALIVDCSDTDQVLRAAKSLQGNLTATLLGTIDDLDRNRELISILERKVGRLIFNSYPTGVEVSHAIVHGGPYPATSDGHSTSVGSQAIFRFVRPVCYQNFPAQVLPPELQNDNPLGILRMVNGDMTRDSLEE